MLKKTGSWESFNFLLKGSFFLMEVHSILENFNFIYSKSPCKSVFLLDPFFLFVLVKVAIATRKLLIFFPQLNLSSYEERCCYLQQ